MYVNEVFPNDAVVKRFKRKAPDLWAAPSPWNDERIERLKKLWSEGLSASLIACRLGGVSRNAVIGKAHRLGLSGRVTVYRKAQSRKPRAKAKPVPRKSVNDRFFLSAPQDLKTSPLPPEPVRPKKLVAFSDLEETHCRFVYGDPRSADHGFCGCKRAPGSSYCAGHHAVVWKASEPRSRENVISRGARLDARWGARCNGKEVVF